jgi:hypothetical protein
LNDWEQQFNQSKPLEMPYNSNFQILERQVDPNWRIHWEMFTQKIQLRIIEQGYKGTRIQGYNHSKGTGHPPISAFFLQIFIYRACGTNEIKSAALSSRFSMESSQMDENLLKWMKIYQIG